MKPTHIPPWIVASAALMLIGAIGPWAKFLGLTIGGMDGDGPIILVGAIVAIVLGILLWRTAKRPRPRWILIVCGIVGLLCAATAFYDWASLEGTVPATGLSDAEQDLVASAVSIGWGLIVAALASVSLLVASISGLVVRRREAEAEVPEAAAPATLDLAG